MEFLQETILMGDQLFFMNPVLKVRKRKLLVQHSLPCMVCAVIEEFTSLFFLELSRGAGFG